MRSIFRFRLPYLIVFVLFPAIIYAQNTAITDDDSYTAHSSAMLDVKSVTKGLLVPRLTQAQRNAITSPADGLLIYQTDNNTGYYYCESSSWVKVGTSDGDDFGDHIADQNIELNGHWLSDDGDSEGINIDHEGKVGIATGGPQANLHVEYNNQSLAILGPAIAFTSTTSNGHQSFMSAQLWRYDGSGWTRKTAGTTASMWGASDGGNFGVWTIPASAALNTGYSNSNNRFIIENDGDVGIGIYNPSTDLDIYESNDDIVPALLIEQGATGDAAMRYSIIETQEITTGIDNDDNDNYKISNTVSLTGTTYGDGNTMLRIHTEANSEGIVDFNHQSRMRAWLDIAQPILPGTWTRIDFTIVNFDEHAEYNTANPFEFTALEDGYYQVNARTEFMGEVIPDPITGGWVSIAIYKNGQMWAQGNNLTMVTNSMDPLSYNNAPNVSDVVYLQAGETISIYAFQLYCNTPIPLMTGTEKTYVSIHKIS